MFEQFATARRRRLLASDERAGVWVREQARAAWWLFIRRQWRVLGGMVTVAVACTSLLAIVAPAGFVRGLVVGGAGVGSLACLAALIVQATGTASTSMGGTAEQWTAGELRGLRRAGWLVVNHVQLKTWDIDHVLIGPAGVFAVETKWSASGWQPHTDNPRLQSALDQVRRNARDLRLWHNLKTTGVHDVSPVLFLWGGGGRPDAPGRPDTPAYVDGVHIVHGTTAARAWRDSLASSSTRPVLNADEIDAAWTAIDAHLRRRAAHQPSASMPTLGRIYLLAMSVLVGGSLTALGSLELLTSTTSWPVWAITAGAAAVALGAANRLTWVRAPAIGGLVGLAISTILVIAAGVQAL